MDQEPLNSNGRQHLGKGGVEEMKEDDIWELKNHPENNGWQECTDKEKEASSSKQNQNHNPLPPTRSHEDVKIKEVVLLFYHHSL